jgi:hypothetical protein
MDAALIVLSASEGCCGSGKDSTRRKDEGHGGHGVGAALTPWSSVVLCAHCVEPLAVLQAAPAILC